MVMANPTTVISPRFCHPNHVNPTIFRKPTISKDGNFVITDDKGNHMFVVKEKLMSFHGRHVVMDSENIPIVTFRKKILSAHKRWQVFQGDSSHSSDLLFTTKDCSHVQFKIDLDIYLPGKKEEHFSDFKVAGSWLEKSFFVCNRDSTPIAQMQIKHTFGRDHFIMTVCYDCEINQEREH